MPVCVLWDELEHAHYDNDEYVINEYLNGIDKYLGQAQESLVDVDDFKLLPEVCAAIPLKAINSYNYRKT